jgi:hypothetical protein
MPQLGQHGSFWNIIINPNLPTARKTRWKKGIIRVWGKVGNDEKLKYVFYPKDRFSRADMERILPQYESCPNCQIDKKFINSKNNNINMSMDIRNFSIVDLLGKIPAIGKYIARNRDISEPIIMQLLATLSRYPTSILMTDLGKRLVSFIVGIAGTAGTVAIARELGKNPNVESEWIQYFTNMITSAAEMPAQGGSFALKDDLRKLRQGITNGNFYGVSDALVKQGSQAQQAVKEALPNFGGSLANFGQKIKQSFNNLFGNRFRMTENTLPEQPRQFSGSSRTPKLGVKEASDYQYRGTEDRFKDISNFGQGFRSKRRLRESGDLLY